MRQKTLDDPLKGFEIGDLVKHKKPLFESEKDQVLIVKHIYREYEMLGLGIEGKKYWAILKTSDVKKVK